MITRRHLLGSAAAVSLGSFSALAKAADEKTPCDYVDPFIGTGGHGHNFPGVSLPFGMVQLSPDTSNNGWDSCSGYHQSDDSIMGFSHTHLSGTGCPDMLDVLVTPRTGAVRLTPGDESGSNDGYRSGYVRASQVARPGYYSVHLTDCDIRAELTATERVGLHRYSFPKGQAGHLIVDLWHANLNWWEHPAEPHVSHASLQLIGDDTLVGGRRVAQWAKGRWIFFAMKLSRPFSRAQIYSDDAPATGDVISGDKLKAALHLADAGDAPLLVKVGLSSVDIEGAIRNIDAEMPDFDFERVTKAAWLSWERELSRVIVESQDEVAKTIFYTGHYHALMAPSLFSDVDRRYRGMDNQIHALKSGEENYSTWSLWDTYRALHPFFTLTQGERLPAMIECLGRMGRESPDGVPIWPLQGRETDTMIGYHAASVLAEAQAKGVKGPDYAAAYRVIRRRAFLDDVHGLNEYRTKGYIPADKVDESVSRTLEYAYSDWTASHLAEAVGERADADALRTRSRNYVNVFDPYTQFMRGRLDNGEWATPFWPDSLGHDQSKWRDFTESNAWQATFLNQHDLYSYMNLFGGSEAFEAKLDGLFNASSAMTDGSLDDISGMVGQYAHGNEPSHHVAYLYAYVGAHYKTQARVRELCDSQYRAAPDGLAGNEDCGQMSAWYLMSAMGFYAVDPVSAIYVFGSPRFDRIRLEVGRGRRFIVEADGNGADACYIQSVTMNGRPWRKTWIRHADIMKGGRLRFVMGRQPNPDFGSAPEDRPPSFVTSLSALKEVL
jgi:predicted alpha-1,2-mannosidase